jgi:hypothetical protein
MPTAEYMRNYRLEHPEYKEKENENMKKKLKERYSNDAEYREKKKKDALDMYYRRKTI